MDAVSTAASINAKGLASLDAVMAELSALEKDQVRAIATILGVDHRDENRNIKTKEEFLKDCRLALEAKLLGVQQESRRSRSAFGVRRIAGPFLVENLVNHPAPGRRRKSFAAKVADKLHKRKPEAKENTKLHKRKPETKEAVKLRVRKHQCLKRSIRHCRNALDVRNVLAMLDGFAFFFVT